MQSSVGYVTSGNDTEAMKTLHKHKYMHALQTRPCKDIHIKKRPAAHLYYPSFPFKHAGRGCRGRCHTAAEAAGTNRDGAHQRAKERDVLIILFHMIVGFQGNNCRGSDPPFLCSVNLVKLLPCSEPQFPSPQNGLARFLDF